MCGMEMPDQGRADMQGWMDWVLGTGGNRAGKRAGTVENSGRKDVWTREREARAAKFWASLAAPGRRGSAPATEFLCCAV